MAWAFPHIKPPVPYIRYLEKPKVRPIHDSFVEQQKLQDNQYLSASYKITVKNSLFFERPDKNESLNKNKESSFHLNHWKQSEGNNKTPREEEELGKATVHALAAGLADKCLQVKFSGKKEMKDLEIQNLVISASRQKIFKLDVLRWEKGTKKIKTKSLQNRILELQRKDIENQSLEASTNALPSVVKQAVEVFFKPGGVTPRIAKEYISTCTLIAIPSPMVLLQNDKDRIRAELRWLLVNHLLQLEEICAKEIKYKKKRGDLNINRRVNLCYTKVRLNHTIRTMNDVWEETQPALENSVIHCQAAQWQKELEAGIERAAKKVAASIITERWKDKTGRKQRRENKIQLRLNDTLSQINVQTDIFELD
nr:hypothetical protein [Klebsormidium sp. LDpt]WKT07908.1 hypothetical protein [Klebsormidium sp. LDpt]